MTNLPPSDTSNNPMRRRGWLQWAVAGIVAVVGLMLGGLLAVLFARFGFSLLVMVLSLGGLVFVVFLATYMLARIFQNAERDRLLLYQSFHYLPQPIFITDRKGVIIFSNQPALALLRHQEFWDVQSALQEIYGRDSLTRQQLLNLQEDGAPETQIELITLGGSDSRWTKLSRRLLPERGGYFLWLIDDIQQLRQQQRAQQQEHDFYQSLLDHNPHGVCCIDEQGYFKLVNQTLARWLGLSAAELIEGGRRLHEFVLNLPERAAPYDLMRPGEFEQSGAIQLRGRDGRVLEGWAEHSLSYSHDGKTMRSRTTIRNLASERATRDALKHARELLQRYFEDAPIGVAMMDEKGVITECNAAFAHLLGVRPEDVPGFYLKDIIHPDDASSLQPLLRDSATSRSPGRAVEVRLQNRQQIGKSTICQIFARPISGGRVGGVILDAIDITEQKNLQAQFAQAQKMQAVGQLAGGVAHDFNNLLTAISGFCDLLLLRHKAGDPSFGDIMQIRQNANRAANLVRQLLAFSRQQTLQPRLLDITDVLAELAHLVRRLIGENIEFKLTHGRDLGLIKGDQGQLEQVLVNLCVNARDAMQSGGKLEIRSFNFKNDDEIRRGEEVMPPGEWVAIEVSDTGTGIPSDVLPRIFEPFFSTKDVGQGTGLGLSTVYGIIRQTDGFITVDSEIGVGTRFTVYLPRQQMGKEDALALAQDLQQQAQQQKREDLTGRGVILLVEDEDAVRSFAARALRHKGYDVIEASSGEAGLEIWAEEGERVDLVLTDVVMPGIDGPNLVRQIRAHKPGLKVIFMSGYTEDRLKHHLGVEEHIYFMQKPFSLKQLAEKVKETLDLTSE